MFLEGNKMHDIGLGVYYETSLNTSRSTLAETVGPYPIFCGCDNRTIKFLEDMWMKNITVL